MFFQDGHTKLKIKKNNCFESKYNIDPWKEIIYFELSKKVLAREIGPDGKNVVKQDAEIWFVAWLEGS